MSWTPLAASSTLVCPTIVEDVTGSLALRAVAGRLAVLVCLLFNVEGVSPSICVDSSVEIVEVTDNASSCKAGGD